MAEKVQQIGSGSAEVQMAAEESKNAHGHEGEGIIKENLHRMINIGIGEQGEDAAEKACQQGGHGSVAISQQEQRDHGADADVTALRHLEKMKLGQDNRHGGQQGGLYENGRSKAYMTELCCQAQQDENGEQCKKRNRMGK